MRTVPAARATASEYSSVGAAAVLLTDTDEHAGFAFYATLTAAKYTTASPSPALPQGGQSYFVLTLTRTPRGSSLFLSVPFFSHYKKSCA